MSANAARHPAENLLAGCTYDDEPDGCAGIDGWYVDDVKVRACNVKKANQTARKD